MTTVGAIPEARPSRRAFIAGLVASGVVACAPARPRAAQSPAGGAGRPDPASFESGDLLWPKPVGAIVPYTSGLPEADEAARWVQDRNDFIARAQRPQASADERETALALSRMGFRQFLGLYLDDQGDGTIAPRSSLGPYYVGHVAIVLRSGSSVDVVEAVAQGVRRVPYQTFLAERTGPDGRGDEIWHGRLAGRAATARARIAVKAAEYTDRPYRFFNFDLNDDSGFYCSKLVWLVVWRTLSVSLDGPSGTFRFPWFSPKRCMRSPHVCLLYEPGPYVEGVTRCP